jgi:hypothetical protein
VLDLDQEEGEWFEIRIVPARYTSTVAKAISTLPTDIEERDAVMAGWLLHMLSGWDLTDQGAPLPVTLESIDKLGYRIKRFMWELVLGALLPNARRPKSSAATSAAAASSEASPTGITTSTPVSGSVNGLASP